MSGDYESRTHPGLSDVIENEDFYGILNVSKQASQEDLKASYRRLCMQYHPDKHAELRKKDAAEMFNRIQTAYDVLSDSNKRHIYDIYGKKGLNADWQLVERKKTQQEIIDEYEQIQRRRELQKLYELTHPQSNFTVHLNATSLFEDGGEDDYSDDDYYPPTLPLLEVTSMTLFQSIQTPLTKSTTMTLGGEVAAENGVGTGQASMSFYHNFSQSTGSEMNFAFTNSAMTCSWSGYRMFGKGLFMTTNVPITVVPIESGFEFIFPGYSISLGHQIAEKIVGELEWNGTRKRIMAANISFEQERLQLEARCQLGLQDSYIRLSAVCRFPEIHSALKLILKLGTFGYMIDLGGEHQITKHSIISSSVSLSVPFGVSLKLRLNRASQSYYLPILLSDELNPTAIFYAFFVPLTFYIGLQKIIIQPYLRRKRLETEDEAHQNLSSETQRKKEEAARIVSLMKESTERIVQSEERKRGLVLLEAWYGKLVHNEFEPSQSTHVIDVKIPLQNLVESSTLQLPADTSKSVIPGFYDPCPSSDKNLKIIYKFRGKIHQVMTDDREKLRIPLKSHLVDKNP